MRVGELARGAAVAAVAPFEWTIANGHWRSALHRVPLSRDGMPTANYSLPALAHISRLDVGGRRVFEYGSGYSTIWWARLGAQVKAVEHDPRWARIVRDRLPVGAPAEVVIASGDEYRDCPLGGVFDVVVVDGEDRPACAEVAAGVCSADGVVIVDDSEGSWASDGVSRPMLDLYERLGWSRIDFVGYHPTSRGLRSTSVFFREPGWFFQPRRI